MLEHLDSLPYLFKRLYTFSQPDDVSKIDSVISNAVLLLYFIFLIND